MTIDCHHCHNAIDRHAKKCPHCEKHNIQYVARLSLLEAQCAHDTALVDEIVRDMKAGVLVRII